MADSTFNRLGEIRAQTFKESRPFADPGPTSPKVGPPSPWTISPGAALEPRAEHASSARWLSAAAPRGGSPSTNALESIIERTRTRTNTIPNGTEANAAG
jgi:hypothetical protein